MNVTLRALTPADLSACHALTTGFGWPHRLDDWALMQRLGTGLVAEQDGAVLGTALRWAFGGRHASVGLVGVAPALQGRGIGRRLMAGILEGLDGTVLLHATKAGAALYESFGFVPGGTVRQHQGTASAGGVIPLAPGERLRPLGRSDPPALLALDRAACGMDRPALLTALLAEGTGLALDRDGALAGFALLCRFGHGHLIGPVVAPDATRARALILNLLGARTGQFTRIDTPAASGLSPWLESLGLACAGEVVRMTRGPAPETQVFALASQAFG